MSTGTTAIRIVGLRTWAQPNLRGIALVVVVGWAERFAKPNVARSGGRA
jgi:hypothetical protein